jgi:quinol monooxygenase YgiN
MSTSAACEEGNMHAQQFFIFGALVLTLCLCWPALAEEAQGPYVRLAELEIDPAQLASFHSAVKEGIDTAVRVEPGVLALYAVAEKEHPSRVIVLEIYTDAQAYAAHLETPHFKQFRATTDKMVTSRKLLDAVPIVLGAKAVAP